MREIFAASYKSFYLAVIGSLWGIAIIFAVIQSGLVMEIAIKTVLPGYGLNVSEANGGLLSGLELKKVTYKDILSADEIRLRPNVGEIIGGDIGIALLDIKNLRIDYAKLEKEIKELMQGDSKKPSYPNAVKIENISVDLRDFKYSDIIVKQLSLKSDYLFYDFEKFYADIDSTVSSNILNASARGHILDKNYSVRGTLSSNGSDYINKIVGDVDFDFNGLKETEYLIRGDDESLYAKAHIKNSGAIYKYGVDAKAKDVISELNMSLKNYALKVASKGVVESTYGDVDAQFDVVYDGNRTIYYGKGKAIRFKKIPLGPFEKSLVIGHAENSEIAFKGDVHKVEVTAKNKVKATLLGERFDVDSSDTTVIYNIDKYELKVDTKAKLQTDYMTADVLSTVEDGKNLKYYGTVKNTLWSKKIEVEDTALKDFFATYEGDENRMSVTAKARDGLVYVDTNGFSIYNFKGELSGIRPLVDGRLSFLKNSVFTGAVTGYYDYKTDETSAKITPKNSFLFGKKLEADAISFRKNPNLLIIPKTKIKIGEIEALVSAQTENKKLDAKLLTSALNIDVHGMINEALQISGGLDLAKGAKEYASLTGEKPQNIKGQTGFNAKLIGKTDNPKITFALSSPAVEFAGEKIERVVTEGVYENKKLTVEKLSADYKSKNYHLSSPSITVFDEHGFTMESLKINNTLDAKFEYKNGQLNGFADITKFHYEDGNKMKFYLTSKVNAFMKDSKLYVTGDAYLDSFEAGFELKSSKITKDKDIVILKPKRLELDEKRFLNDVTLRLNITTANGKYKSKEAYAPLDMDLVYYKDFGKKPSLIGLIKTKEGYYDFEGKKFVLLPSQIALLEGEDNNPYLDLTLKHADKDTEIFVYVKEYASSPHISFSSKPAMSEKEIISYLLFGVDPDSSFTKTQSDAKYSSKAIGALSNALSRDLAMEFGIRLDKIEISPTETIDKSGKTMQTTKVEIGKKITKDLTVIYKNDIESSVVFEYKVNKNVNVESQAGRKSSIDIFYKQDY